MVLGRFVVCMSALMDMLRRHAYSGLAGDQLVDMSSGQGWALLEFVLKNTEVRN